MSTAFSLCADCSPARQKLFYHLKQLILYLYLLVKLFAQALRESIWMATFTQQTDNEIFTIHVNDAFIFTDKNHFMTLIERKSADQQLVINLVKASHMDSTALGLLLNVRDKLGGESADIILDVGDNKEVMRLLEINKLYKLFRIK